MPHAIVSKGTKSLLVPAHPGVLQMFPDAPLLPCGNKIAWDTVVIPHGLRETLLLRHLGVKVPNPIDVHYDWAGAVTMGKPPYDVQRRTCCMLTENPRAYVLNGMGTGKTRTALWSWDFMNKSGLANKCLVVAPLSTLRFVWGREVFSTLPGRKVQILHGTRKQRILNLAQDADVYVINHDGLQTVATELLARPDIDTLIIDEIAVYRNNNNRSKYMRKFAQRFKIIWGMTGTPMPNEPTDVWAQCQIVTPHRVPKQQTHARDMLMSHIPNTFVWTPRQHAKEVAFDWMKPACRFSLKDVVELPPVIFRTIDVPLSAAQQTTYKRVATAMVAMVRDKVITAVNAGAAMNKLLQIAGGWVYTINPDFVRVDATPRILALADLIDSASRKVIVAIPYRHMMDGISAIFNMKNVGIDHAVINGSTTGRDAILNAFQNTGKYKALLVDPRCVHHGLTLTSANTIVWYLPTTSLDIYDQLNARITRIGQTDKQQIIHLQGTAVERKTYKALLAHQKLQNQFLRMVEEATDGED